MPPRVSISPSAIEKVDRQIKMERMTRVDCSSKMKFTDPNPRVFAWDVTDKGRSLNNSLSLGDTIHRSFFFNTILILVFSCKLLEVVWQSILSQHSNPQPLTLDQRRRLDRGMKRPTLFRHRPAHGWVWWSAHS